MYKEFGADTADTPRSTAKCQNLAHTLSSLFYVKVEKQQHHILSYIHLEVWKST